MKEWTMLVYLNGNNNLDSYGSMDLNEMEKVGSSDQVNVVVQWASMKAETVKRLLVQKDNDPKTVTSPVVMDAGKVDMGDYHSLTDFIKWGAKNYPAKHYFVDIWDHGNGWHIRSGILTPNDISWDDKTGSFMTTKQLGQALRDASAAIGQKIDLYGSDACLMNMMEVTDEVADSVNAFVGSEEVEPAEGWPYDMLLSRWEAKPSIGGIDVAKILTEEYVKSYQGGSQGTLEVTFSALDLTKLDQLNAAVASLGKELMGLQQADRKKIVNVMYGIQTFTYSDYGDLVDFVSALEKAEVTPLNRGTLSNVREAVKAFVAMNMGTSEYAKATGVSIWLPSSKFTYDRYSTLYNDLRFQSHTGWGDALKYLLQDDTSGT